VNLVLMEAARGDPKRDVLETGRILREWRKRYGGNDFASGCRDFKLFCGGEGSRGRRRKVW
jgi:hypothetical protein